MKKGTALLVVTILSIFLISLVVPSTSAALVSYWKMDDNAANTLVLDDNNGNNNGTANVNTNLRSVAGYDGTALNFTGTGAGSDYVSLGDNPSFEFISGNDNFTIVGWMNPRTFANNRMIMSKYHSTGQREFMFYTGADQKLHLDTRPTGAGAQSLANANTALNASEWQHIAVVKNGTIAVFYVNGVYDGNGTAVVAMTGGTALAIIGATDRSSTEPDYGVVAALDEFRVYNHSLTAADIAALYSPTVPPKITIVSPLNQTYNVSSILFNVSSDIALGVCNFTINNWATNYSMTVAGNYANYTNSSMDDGQYTTNFWCDDGGTQVNNTESITFIVDTTFPQINFTEVGNAVNYANVTRDWIFVNVTWNETNADTLLFRLHNSTGEVNVTSYTTFTDPYSINWTGLPDETYTYNATLNDTAAYPNSTLTRTITLDTQLFVNIVSPLNQSYNISSILFNVSSDEDFSVCKFTINDWATNYSMTVVSNYSNYTNSSMDDGQYTSRFWCNDSSNNINNTELITFIVDTIDPQINYSGGTAVDYANVSSTSIFVNTTWNETNPSAIVFRLHNATAEINVTTYTSLTGGTTEIIWTGLPDEANYTYNVTLNDTAGNSNFTLTRTITLNQSVPQLTIISPLNQSYNVSSILFNISANKALNNCNFSLNNGATNYSMTVNGMYANYTNGSMIAGGYTSDFWCNDTLGNINSTESIQFIIDLTAPKINYTTPTPSNGTNQTFNSLFIDTIWEETNPGTMIFRLHNSTGEYNVTSITNPITTISDCYQESANVSNQTGIDGSCGLDYTGSYESTEAGDGWRDGDWKTSTVLDSNHNFTVNYTIPLGANGAKLQTNITGPLGANTLMNTTIDLSVCDNNNILSLVIASNRGGGQTSTNLSCYNSGVWNFIGLVENGDGRGSFFEEAMIWNVTSESLNFTNLPDGIYFFNVSLNDTAGSVNITETRRVLVDTLNPNVSLISPGNVNTSNVSINFTALMNDSGGIENATLWIFNSTGGLYNKTVTSFVAGVTSKTLGIVVTMIDGFYSWLYEVFDWVGHSTNSTTFNLTADNTTPIINITFPSVQVGYHKDATNLTFNWSYIEANPDTCFLDYTGTNFTVNCTDNSSKYTPVNITDYSNRNATLWMNDSAGGSAPFTRNWTYKFFERNTTFSTWSYEGDYQTFVLNMSTDNVSRINTTYLVYNGSSYLATKQGATANANFSESINVPMVGDDNQSFFWNVIYGDSDGNVSVNSTYLYNQTIIPINLVRCNSSVDTPYYNFTFKDELNTSLSLSAATNAANFVYYLNNSLYNNTYLFSNLTANPSYGFCFTPPNKTLYVGSVDYQYSATNYPLRKWDNTSVKILANYTINKTLWLLSSLDGQYVTFTVSDTSGTALNGSEISITRVIEGNVVEVGQDTTDATGSATFFLYPAASHSVSITRINCTSAILAVTPTQTSYAITLNCLGSSVIGGESNIEGVRYSRSPFVGGTTYTGTENVTFDFLAVSLVYNITKAKFELYYSNGTFITSNETFVPTAYCNATECYMKLELNVSVGDDIKARYYLAVNNTDTGETGYILLEGDAHWRFITQIDRGAGTVKKTFNNLRDLFYSWRPVGTDPISGWNFTDEGCELLLDEVSCNTGGCRWANSTASTDGTCISLNHLNRVEYSRIVFLFLFMAIVLSIFGRLTGYDAQNSGFFLFIITAFIGLATFSNGITGPGFFYYDNLTPIPFLNNTMLFITVGFFTLGHYLSLTRRST